MNASRQLIYRRANPPDYKGILNLQRANFAANLSEAEARDGFLSIEFTEEQFDSMNRDLGVAVAVRQKEIVGYMCGSSFEYNMQFPILTAMIGALPGLTVDDTLLSQANAFIYGPVCVARSVRGSGILQGMYQTLKMIARPRYSCCVLFISGKNGRSLTAHSHKLDMRDLGRFTFRDNLFHILGSSIQDNLA